MVPDIVMPNAHKISSSLMDKVTSMDGTHLHLIQTPVKVNGVLAALRWIFGKPIPSQVLSPHILASTMAFTNVKTKMNVVTQTDM